MSIIVYCERDKGTTSREFSTDVCDLGLAICGFLALNHVHAATSPDSTCSAFGRRYASPSNTQTTIQALLSTTTFTCFNALIPNIALEFIIFISYDFRRLMHSACLQPWRVDPQTKKSTFNPVAPPPLLLNYMRGSFFRGKFVNASVERSHAG